jgi:hypothetical protein
MEKESLIKLYTKQWQCCHSFTAEENHTCSMERCNIQHVIGGVWRRGTETHACIRSLCKNHPTWANRGTLRKQYRNMYMCCRTGTPHWCDEQCQCTVIDHSDGGHVCQISGIRYDSIKSDTWFMYHRVTATHQENKDPLKLVRNTNFKMDIESSETIRQQQHVFISRAQVSAIMFSNERLFMEQRKYVEMKHEAEKVIQKYIKSCEKNGHVVVFTTIVALYINQMNRRFIFKNLIPKERSVDDVVKQYANTACKYWTLITKQFPLGIQTPALFPLKIFVVSIMYIMKGGLCLGGVRVIPKDKYLASVLPEANTLDSYNINKPAFTACKNNILKAYREASEVYHINPKKLMLRQ